LPVSFPQIRLYQKNMHIQALPVTLIASAIAAVMSRAWNLLCLPIGYPAMRPVAAG